jgi:hypothetical protein
MSRLGANGRMMRWDRAQNGESEENADDPRYQRAIPLPIRLFVVTPAHDELPSV